MEGSSKVVHMNGGVGETSYAHNSSMQSTTLSITEHIKRDAISKMFQTCMIQNPHPYLSIADLGCSSGPNALLAAHQLIAAIDEIRQESGHESLDIQLLLNDLPKNDFNTVFRSLQNFHKQVDSKTIRCFVSGVPGSFYRPLFPRESVHFVHSSYSLHWLSRAPENLELSNKGEVSVSRGSPESVREEYREQFKADFSTFLGCRWEEMVAGGCMVFTLLSRPPDEQSVAKEDGWTLLSLALRQMVSEGLIDEEKLDAFNIPLYPPSEREIRDEVSKQGKFYINCAEASEVGWEDGVAAEDLHVGIVGAMRAVAEPLLVAVFGGEVMDELFARYANILREAISNKTYQRGHHNLTVSLTKLP